MAELGNPPECINCLKVDVSKTLQDFWPNVTFRSRSVTSMREVSIGLLQPAQGINDVAVDHDFKMEVAAG